MEKKLLFGLLSILIAGTGFGGISMANEIMYDVGNTADVRIKSMDIVGNVYRKVCKIQKYNY